MNISDPVVYVVDDESSIRKLFELFLKSRGFTVETLQMQAISSLWKI